MRFQGYLIGALNVTASTLNTKGSPRGGVSRKKLAI